MMIKNYIKVGFRSAIRDKAFTVINLSGLVLGMMCFLFIFLWIQDEKSMDGHHGDNGTLYNVFYTVTSEGKKEGTYATPPDYDTIAKRYFPLLEGVEDEVSGIERTNFYVTGYELPWGYPETFEVGDKRYKLEGARAGADFFQMFNYPIIAGNAVNPLQEIGTIAISRKMAHMFFNGPEDAVGKTMRYENTSNFTVTAVFEDVTPKSTWSFDFLINWESYAKNQVLRASHNIQTTIQLTAKASVPQVAQNLNAYLQKRINPENPISIEAHLQPFADKYLKGNFENGKPSNGRIAYVRLFGGVALFILFIACINYMNLATAKSTKRAKEVGIRKAIGSSRTFLIKQFLAESTLLSFCAILVSILLTGFLLPYFNQLTGKQIALPYTNYGFWLTVLLLVLVTGFVAGSYPALFLSSLKPVKVLRGTLIRAGGSKWFRKGLTTFQFGLCILLFIATLVVSKQTDYLQNSHLGYDRDNLIYVRIEGALADAKKYATFKEEASKLPGIAMVDRSSETPHSMEFEVADPILWEGKPIGKSVGFMPKSVGFDFLKIMNLKVAEGRGFSRNITTDATQAFMVNQEAVKQMGLQDPLGKWVSAWDKKGRVVGILEDYHTASLHQKIKPVIVDVKEDLNFGVILVRTEPGKTKEALASLKSVYQKLNPSRPFDYQFADAEYQALYQSEQLMSRLSNVFALLAMAISAFGLLGLAMFSAQQRTKEMGVRKVLGASNGTIVKLFSEDILKLVGISFLITTPLAWLLMNRWLQDFAYKIPLSWWIFALAGLAAFLIAFMTISTQSLRIAYTNPSKSLRTE